MSFLASLISTPWAILEDYRHLIAGVLARISSGETLSAPDMERVRERRREWDARHVAELAGPDARGGEHYTRVPGSGSSDSIAVIPVYGVLTQRGGVDMDTSEPLTSMARLAYCIQLAAADSLIGGIVLDVDSPGGSVYGVSELGDVIHAANRQKPIAAVCNSLMASAAYWASSQAGEVYCAPGAEVGSIGVYTVHTNVAELLKQRGIAVEMISAGKFKTEGNPYGPLSDQGRAHIQASVDQYYDAFVRAVARGRGSPLKNVREGMGQGRVLQAEQAKAENMIDGIATLGQVISKMQARAKRTGSSASGVGSGVSARAAMRRELEILRLT